MSKYNNALNNERFHIQSLRLVILVLAMICFGLGFGWYQAPKNLIIHNPPDLRSGSTRVWWEIPPSSVYAFSFYIFQQLNRWPTSGEVDYKRNIDTLKNYLTPQCYAYLQRDYEQRKTLGELRDRVRGVYEIPGRGFSDSRVKINGDDNWNVTLDLSIDEYYLDNPVKRALYRYPINVVRYDIDPEKNPWGLALNCYSGSPQRIENEQIEPQKESKNLQDLGGNL